MIGFYDYTVILTYASLLSASTGIMITLSGGGHPYLGVFFLLLCGLLDSFDGKVARTKKNRTEMEKNYGIQIDSLSDLVAFGVLPACIGASLFRISPYLGQLRDTKTGAVINAVLWSVLVLYVLAALIRLAYFNVTEEERQRKEDTVRKYYTGLPVTSASLIFPAVMLIKYIVPIDISVFYFVSVIITGFAFLSKFQVKKPTIKGILILIFIGMLEAAVLITLLYLKIRGII